MATKYTSYIFDPENQQYVQVQRSSATAGASYDELEDLPIINQRGPTKYNFINISSLDYGKYSLSGYYKWETSDTVHNLGNERIEITITQDESTGKKIVMYNTVDNGDVYNNVIVYDGTAIEKTIKKKTSANYWGVFG